MGGWQASKIAGPEARSQKTERGIEGDMSDVNTELEIIETRPARGGRKKKTQIGWLMFTLQLPLPLFILQLFQFRLHPLYVSDALPFD
jgi:hypothetical protein